MTTDSSVILDVLRLFVGGMAGITACITALVIMHYRNMLRRGHDGILASHVLMASITLILSCLYIGVDAFTRVGMDYWTWRLPLGLAVFVCGGPTLVLILMHVRRRDREMELQNG